MERTGSPHPGMVARRSAVAGLQEVGAFFRPGTWLGGWVTRLAFQVVFYGLAGRFIGEHDLVAYLLIGNAMAVIALEGVRIAPMARTQRGQGTVMLLVCSPASPVAAILGRSVVQIALGFASSSIVFTGMALIFRLGVSWPRNLLAFPVMLAISCSCFGYGSFMAALLYRFDTLRNVSNISYMTISVFAGVNVPTSYWPRPIQVFAQFLPVTHGLQAVRSIMGESGYGGPPLLEVPLELAVGAGWFAAACLLLRAMINTDRQTGRLDFS
jgi:ABC-2 type transport system permease protein